MSYVSCSFLEVAVRRGSWGVLEKPDVVCGGRRRSHLPARTSSATLKWGDEDEDEDHDETEEERSEKETLWTHVTLVSSSLRVVRSEGCGCGAFDHATFHCLQAHPH